MTRLYNDSDEPITIEPGEEVRLSDEQDPDIESTIDEGMGGLSKRYTLIKLHGRIDD